MRIDILTIFPDMFTAPLSESMVGIARTKGLLEVECHDLRDYTSGKHRQVDDEPYGGGHGMVMKPEPFFRAVKDLKKHSEIEPFVVLLSPAGRRLNQDMLGELAAIEKLILLCGRYEGVDERVGRFLADDEVSVGDFVLSGGEIPAMLIVDGVARLLEGVLGHDRSAVEESFSSGLLEYPQYIRPRCYEGHEVPEVLLSGDHARITEWRTRQAMIRTATRRPDLLASGGLSAKGLGEMPPPHGEQE